uniref:Methyltransferase FkbM domain-containing protein n=1 Tax=Haptolina brevifila TaxID=156173 RepID=A0A7S2DM68_9EUKA|mmetsp:Transcript_39834/g.79662  ORF Transcript_39834/g.79662 Transcript_39834/m.79662 type:complete len:249 (+) Transcript_39834:70-816(+)
MAMADHILAHLSSPNHNGYQLQHPNKTWYSQFRQDEKLWPLLRKFGPRSFFVESGAFDGETHSNTLSLERKGWHGLLVEPDPANHEALKARQRRAHLFFGGLSTTQRDGNVDFAFDRNKKIKNYGENGGLAQYSNWRKTGGPGGVAQNIESVYVAPLPAILHAIGRRHVDYWSLDVEGAEEHILSAIFEESSNLPMIEFGVLQIETVSEHTIKLLLSKGFVKKNIRTTLDQFWVNQSYLAARGISVTD